MQNANQIQIAEVCSTRNDRVNMFVRFALLVALSLAAQQVALASEDIDRSDPQTALWAIARYNSYIVDNQKEAAQIVEASAVTAKSTSGDLVASQIAAWQAPIDAAMAKAIAAGVKTEDAELCKSMYKLDDVIAQATTGVPLCVVVARTQYDARVKKIQANAEAALDYIIQAQSDINTCAKKPGELLQAMCRLTKLTWTVISAEKEKDQALTAYFEVYNKAADGINQDAKDCTNALIKRLTWTAELNVNNTVQCLEDDIPK